MTTTLARRLAKLEAVQREAHNKRWQAALSALIDSMDGEHHTLFRAWMREHCPDFRVYRLPGDTWYTVLDRYRPPALVRAVWILMLDHMASGNPVSLPANVAEVYLSDPDAIPTNGCEGCGYLMPTQTRIRPDDTYKHSGWYTGVCPVCGLDNHPEDEERA